MVRYEIVIIGGGPAGLAAAVAAKAAGAKKIVILERDERLGGILNQCIHIIVQVNTPSPVKNGKGFERADKAVPKP